MVGNLFGTPHACEIYSAFKITLRSPSADFWYSHPKTQAPFCMCSVQVKTECSSKIMAIATHPFKCKNSVWLNRGFKYQEMNIFRVNFLLKIIFEVLPVLTAVIYSVHWIVRQYQTNIRRYVDITNQTLMTDVLREWCDWLTSSIMFHFI